MTAIDHKQHYEQLLQAHRGIVYKVAYSYSRSAEDREDLVQDICLQLWRAFPRYDPARKFSTWMYRVALNVAMTHARRVYRDGYGQWESLSEAHLETIASGENVEQQDQLDALHGFISHLEPLNRAVIMLYLDGCSYTEIADVVDLSETNVATKINRIKHKLRGQAAAAMTGE